MLRVNVKYNLGLLQQKPKLEQATMVPCAVCRVRANGRQNGKTSVLLLRSVRLPDKRTY